MVETIFVWVLVYAMLGAIILYIAAFDDTGFEKCGILTCLLLWPLILLGILITGLMKICKVIADEWNRG